MARLIILISTTIVKKGNSCLMSRFSESLGWFVACMTPWLIWHTYDVVWMLWCADPERRAYGPSHQDHGKPFYLSLDLYITIYLYVYIIHIYIYVCMYVYIYVYIYILVQVKQRKMHRDHGRLSYLFSCKTGWNKRDTVFGTLSTCTRSARWTICWDQISPLHFKPEHELMRLLCWLLKQMLNRLPMLWLSCRVGEPLQHGNLSWNSSCWLFTNGVG
jgi:hypothetical protein